MSGACVGRLPLSALLSRVLVAFTIECDNEFGRQMPHRTSNYASTAGRGARLWLVSMAMWWTCMRFVGEDGITVAELTRRPQRHEPARHVALEIHQRRTGPSRSPAQTAVRRGHGRRAAGLAPGDRRPA
jgi:hypothetical protein